jgi:antitoxin CptB
MGADPNNDRTTKNRLYWRCRRGMAELDFLLQNYLEKNYQAFSAADLSAFQKLLDIPDALLLEYLLRGSVPVDPVTYDVVKKIRAAVTN